MNKALSIEMHDDSKRIAALQRYEILDTDPEKDFQDLIELVKNTFNTAFAAINLIDSDRQWSKASAGYEVVECRREDAFCNHTIKGFGPLVVEDTRVDNRFNQNCFVTGEPNILSYLGAPLVSSDGYNIGAVCVFDTFPRTFSEADVRLINNFSKVIMSQFELRLMARRDNLTGCLTRNAFYSRLENYFKSEDRAAMLVLDIDKFKSINDAYGHQKGDNVIKTVASVIQSEIRHCDYLSRIGGEEFAVMIAGIEEGMSWEISERIRKRIEKIKEVEIPETVTVSIGIAIKQPCETIDDWIKRADLAMYRSKLSGRNMSTIAS